MKDEPSTPTVPLKSAEDVVLAQQEGELAIARDVFNPDETDEQYFRRRLAYHQARRN